MPAIIELPEITEGSTGTVSMSFRDDTGAPVTPSSLWYKIVNEDAAVIRVKTAVISDLSPDMTIPLSNTDTRIVTDTKARERRFMVVQAIYGANRRINQEFVFSVVNLRYGVAADGI